MFCRLLSLLVAGAVLAAMPVWAESPPLSEATLSCLGCHEDLHPGMVEGWRASRHARITPGQALQTTGLASKISSTDIPSGLQDTSVGCAECHTLRPDAHADTFDHFGYQVHVVVSPEDCATCHATERKQYGQNIMAHAYGNLVDNAVYADLRTSINGVLQPGEKQLSAKAPNNATKAESCLYCHGTKLRFDGLASKDTAYGPVMLPEIAGWPNQGSGRINLDGSKGSCAVCHTRHRFSMAEARKPYTCKECHVGPDVPAYKVYTASKHGTIYSAENNDWDFSAVPWEAGTDFRAPTCAACHISLVTKPGGTVVAERTHALSPRLPWRIFGLPYAHPQPKDPQTSKIKNAAGLPLPTNLDGSPASDFLISAEEQDKRKGNLQAVCLSCHTQSWVDGHWQRFENTIEVTNEATATGTGLLAQAWENDLAEGLPQNSSIFDEYIENVWSDIWLIHCNHIRFASAIGGGGDYGVFADGRYVLNKRLREMHDWVESRLPQQ